MLSKLHPKAKDTLFLAVVLLVLIAVSTRVRREFFNVMTPNGVPPEPTEEDIKAAKASGTAVPGILNPLGQDLLISSIPAPAACNIKGIVMPPTFERPADAQIKNIPNSENACVISAEYPGVATACANNKSVLYHDEAVQQVTFVPSASGNSTEMQCMVLFKGDASDASLRKYRTNNDPNEQSTILRATNSELLQLNNALEADKAALKAAEARLKTEKGELAEKLQETIRSLTSRISDSAATVDSITRMRDALQTQLADRTRAANAETAAIIDALRKRAEEAEKKQASCAADSLDYRPGLKIDVFDLSDDGGQFQAGAKRFTTYGPKLYGMDIIDFPNTAAWWGDDSWLGNRVFIEMTGFLDIPEDRDYRFFVITDDGANIRVNGETIISSMRLQGYGQHVSEPIKLSKGRVTIETRWYENWGAKVYMLGWDYPSGRVLHHRIAGRTVYIIPPNRYSYVRPRFMPAPPAPTTMDFAGNWSQPMKPTFDAKNNIQSEWARSGYRNYSLHSATVSLRPYASTRCNASSMSIAFWVFMERIDPDGRWRNILHVSTGVDHAGGNRRPAIFITPGTTRMHICSDTTHAINEHYNTSYGIPINVRTLVVITYNNRSGTCYMYNKRDKRIEPWTFTGMPLQPPSNANVYAGSYYPWYNPPDYVHMQNLRFYNTVLTRQDVAMIYNAEEWKQA